MKSRKKIIIVFTALFTIAVSYFLFNMKGFADGVKHDASHPKRYAPQKLADSITLILGDSVKPR